MSLSLSRANLSGRLPAPVLHPCVCAAALLLTAPAALAEPAGDTKVTRIRELSLEDVLNAEVTSVSKRPERLFDSAAAAFVITDEDIRRAGARSLPEALRLAPGVNVAQQNASTWAVSVRGFSDIFADKLLVLRDGRTLYSPVLNGVFWNTQDYLLADIDRIEVIRGPGGTLWGANAVNGVINIITKDARDTQGLYMTAGGGNADRGFAGLRYGMNVTENNAARVYVNGGVREFRANQDGSEILQGGFRDDWRNDQNHLTIQGDYYAEGHHNRFAVPQVTAPYFPFSTEYNTVTGGNLLARFQHEVSEDSQIQLQAYYDQTLTRDFGAKNRLSIADVDLQHRLVLPLRQTVTYGVGYRYQPSRFADTPILTYIDKRLNPQIFNAFVQDEIGLVDKRLRLTLGTKVEHNDYTGWEVQPNARLLWTPAEKHTLWGAVSRATQTPAPNITDISVRTLAIEPTMVPVEGLGTVPMFLRGLPNPDLKSQEMIGYEVGYRVQPARTVALDFAGFYNEYDNLITGTIGTPTLEFTPSPHLVLPTSAANGGAGRTYGFELSAQWEALESWRLSLAYSHLQVERSDFSSSGQDPKHQISLRSSSDLPGNLKLDLWGRFVDRLPLYGVRSYFDLDVRLAWEPRKDLTFAIVGQNLLESSRFEFGQSVAVRTEVVPVPRSVYGQVEWRF